MARLADIAARIDALAFKERALILVAGLLILGLGWDTFLNKPYQAQRAALVGQIADANAAAAALKATAVQVEREGKTDPDAGVKAQIAQLRAQIKASRDALLSERPQLIPPAQMAEVLKNVLGKSGKLTLLGLTGLGAQPLTGLPAAAQAPAGKPEVPPVATVVAYRHGLRIEVAGSYLDVLAYLHGLETLPWKFLWDSVDYKVKSYPQGTATIVVYTLSLDPAWIGI